MTSTQSSPENLKTEDYIRIFQEGYDLDMPPYDFRVWDRYLFSRCPNEQASGLLGVFRAAIKILPGSPEENIRTFGEWCKRGTFADEFTCRNVSASMTRDLAAQQFLEENEAIFKTMPLGLSKVETVHQTVWLEQAKDCIIPANPIRTNRETVKTPEQKRKEAYFAFGMIVWNIMPEPHWVLQHDGLDVWYNLGFAIAHQQDQEKMLFERYRNLYSGICGVSKTTFELFFRSLGNQFMFAQLTTSQDTNTMKTELRRNLKNFLLKEDRQQNEESVWRLHQWTCLRDEDVIRMKETKVWGVFEKARLEYALTQNDAEMMSRKEAWAEVLMSLDDPLELHRAKEDPGLHEYLKKWCAKYNKSHFPVDRIYCKNPTLSL